MINDANRCARPRVPRACGARAFDACIARTPFGTLARATFHERIPRTGSRIPRAPECPEKYAADYFALFFVNIARRPARLRALTLHVENRARNGARRLPPRARGAKKPPACDAQSNAREPVYNMHNPKTRRRARPRARQRALVILQRPRARMRAKRFASADRITINRPSRAHARETVQTVSGSNASSARARARNCARYSRANQSRAQARETVYNAHYSRSCARAPARKPVCTIYDSGASRAQARETVYAIYESPERAPKRAKRFATREIQPPRARERAKRFATFMRPAIARACAQNGLQHALLNGSRARARARNGLHYVHLNVLARASAKNSLQHL